MLPLKLSFVTIFFAILYNKINFIQERTFGSLNFLLSMTHTFKFPDGQSRTVCIYDKERCVYVFAFLRLFLNEMKKFRIEAEGGNVIALVKKDARKSNL